MKRQAEQKEVNAATKKRKTEDPWLERLAISDCKTADKLETIRF